MAMSYTGREGVGPKRRVQVGGLPANPGHSSEGSSHAASISSASLSFKPQGHLPRYTFITQVQIYFFINTPRN